jgi:DNA invertase Pin-like site-specific DNA recombinase
MPRKSRKNLFQNEFVATETKSAAQYVAWGYVRISNDGEKSEDSIENQTAIIQDYVRDKTDLDLRSVVKDLGFSGTNFDRPGYAELLAGIISGDVQCVVVKDLSRLGRTYIEVGELLFDTFPAYNVRFISVNDNYDSFADDAARKKLLILFKNLVNHMYSKDMSKKIRSSFVLKQQKGELLGSIPPYGYQFTTEGGGKRLTIEPESAKIVKLIFDMRENGGSMVKIAEYLNCNDIPAPRNHYHKLGVLKNDKDAKRAYWHNGYIGNLLRNEVYIGSQIQGKYDRRGKIVEEKSKENWYIYENAHLAIIGKTQFENVQKLLDEAGENSKNLATNWTKIFLSVKFFVPVAARR